MVTTLNFNKSKIVVVGDLMIDEYWSGSVKRISPEAPVPVVKINNKDYLLGGAANVALNLKKIGCNVSLFGSIGDDNNGKLLTKIIKENKIKFFSSVKKNTKTISKLRIVSDSSHMIRLDFEDCMEKYKFNNEKVLKKEILSADTVVFSDYNKGTLKDINLFIQFAKKYNKLVVVDPKGDDYSKYRGATLITPNLKEFYQAVGVKSNMKIMSSHARKLIKKFKIENIIITKGSNGMSLVSKNNELHLPAIAREVYDVTGAGDTVVALMAACIGINLPITTAMKLANQAASQVVGKVGNSFVTIDDINNSFNREKINLKQFNFKNEKDILISVKKIKESNKTIVMTNGCFDIIHPGHLHLFKQAKTLGEFLIVAINDDKSVRRLKGKSRPINDLKSRVKILEAIKHVDAVVVFKEDTPEKIIRIISPDILVKGGDYNMDQVIGAKYVTSKGGKVKIIKFLKGHSSTSIINKTLKTN